MNNKPLVDDRYTQLARVLMDAMEQAAGGKGMERHADGEAFENQKICVINRWLRGSPIAGPLFQAVKKSVESSRMDYGAAIRELYGAINYLSAGILLLEELRDSEKPEKEQPLQIEMNCLCLDAGKHYSEEAANRELRELGAEQELADIPDHSTVFEIVPDEIGVFEAPLCDDCFYMRILPNEMPCKKCLDKPFKPHFTKTDKIYKVQA